MKNNYLKYLLLFIIIVLLLFFYSINYLKNTNKIKEDFNNIIEPIELSLFIENNNENNISNKNIIKLSNEVDNVLENKKLSYYRCKDKMIGTVLKNIFDSNNIISCDQDIYIEYRSFSREPNIDSFITIPH